MARNFHRKERLSTVSQIDLTPLIDLAFSLLIIFMITTPLLEQTIALDLPIESSKEQVERNDSKYQVVSIDDKGNYYWGKEIVDAKKLNLLLKEISAEKNPPTLDIRGHNNIPYQKVVDLLDLISKNNLSKISLNTQVK
ncbi:MAG: biopolymer transporter ExbD [Verrucomicrobia bacterium]|nr:MAG: biopolymer transporter ExbD [Verrucomicrobiota bacterium]